MQLEHSTVQRGGVTSPYWYGGTDRIQADVVEKGVQFRFTLPSKGGGDTLIALNLGFGDIRAILKNLAAERPELADLFIEAMSIAVARLLKSPEQKVSSSDA